MSAKIVAIAAMGLVVAAGGFLVSKAESPATMSSTGVGVDVAGDDSTVATISRGEEVDLRKHVDPDGGYTLFMFTADW